MRLSSATVKSNMGFDEFLGLKNRLFSQEDVLFKIPYHFETVLKSALNKKSPNPLFPYPLRKVPLLTNLFTNVKNRYPFKDSGFNTIKQFFHVGIKAVCTIYPK